MNDANLAPSWNSDVIALALRQLGFDYISLNPGASYRGLHDSLVNFLGNDAPRMLTCLHEEHAVSIAHGYAKASGRSMAVALHTNVGLLHASMAIFNAYCDRVPMVIIGAQGPLDAASRRPWIDWLHTTADAGAPVRAFVKWDDEALSVTAALESIVRAKWHAEQLPAGPTFVSLDSAMQEQPYDGANDHLPVRSVEPSHPELDADSLRWLGDRLLEAERPILLFGRGSRSKGAWEARVQLAELLGAGVITDLRAPAVFPTTHPQHVGYPALTLSDAARATLSSADVVAALDPIDLAGALTQARVDAGEMDVVSISLDAYGHNGFVKEHQRFVPSARYLAGCPDAAVAGLIEHVTARGEKRPSWTCSSDRAQDAPSTASEASTDDLSIGIRGLARAVAASMADEAITYVRFPIGWPGDVIDFTDPMDFLGGDGGAGLASGAGLAVGAALALHGSERVPLAILGDGDFLMGSSALWTASAHRLAGLIVVANNRSNFNDELHQERVARERDRPVENRWVGQRLDDPPIDIAALASSYGVVGRGPVESRADLPHELEHARALAKEGAFVVLDVLIRPEYDAGAVMKD